MTVINSGLSISAFVSLSVLCLGIAMMFVGGWYFQSSLVELNIQQKELQSSLAELKAQKQENRQVVQQLKEIVKTHGKQLVELQLQLKTVSTAVVTINIYCLQLGFHPMISVYGLKTLVLIYLSYVWFSFYVKSFGTSTIHC